MCREERVAAELPEVTKNDYWSVGENYHSPKLAFCDELGDGEQNNG